MKPSAVLVNTSRGPVVDEAALVGVLSEGRIRAAAIDVFHTEPLPAHARSVRLGRTAGRPRGGPSPGRGGNT